METSDIGPSWLLSDLYNNMLYACSFLFKPPHRSWYQAVDDTQGNVYFNMLTSDNTIIEDHRFQSRGTERPNFTKETKGNFNFPIVLGGPRVRIARRKLSPNLLLIYDLKAGEWQKKLQYIGIGRAPYNLQRRRYLRGLSKGFEIVTNQMQKVRVKSKRISELCDYESQKG